MKYISGIKRHIAVDHSGDCPMLALFHGRGDRPQRALPKMDRYEPNLRP